MPFGLPVGDAVGDELVIAAGGVTDPVSIEHVADMVDEDFAGGRDINMGMWDGRIRLDAPPDASLNANPQTCRPLARFIP